MADPALAPIAEGTVAQGAASPGATGRWVKAVAGIYTLGCVVLDLFPHHGPAWFRYTGSDPARAVWNLGYPFVLMIDDPQKGLNVGPFALLVVPLQLCPVALVFVVARVARWLHQAGRHKGH